MFKPKYSPLDLINGATTITAKNPYTTVGIPARISVNGLIISLVFFVAYSDIYIADIKPIGPAIIIAINAIKKVPVNNGIAPKAPEEPT